MATSDHITHARQRPWRRQEGSGYANSHKADDPAPLYDIRKEEASPRTLPIHSPIGTLTHFTVCFAWLFYLGLRLQTCLQASSSSLHMQWAPWLFFLCETILAGPDLFQILEVSLSFAPGSRGASRPCYRLHGTSAPSVHVFITTCGEDLGIVMDTVAAAALQDYPKHCFRVFVLDDANEPKLRRDIDAFNAKVCKNNGIQPVTILSRSKKPGELHYYKAGNLSFGIRTSNEQYGSSEFIAGLDADMIAERDWLQRTVPHLVLGPELAVASPPQYSYNVPDGDILAQDANVLQQVLEPVRDRIGCSMCHGSGYVMRREALDAIGGWPLVNVGEDILCSYLLNRAGWQTAFIEDKLQFGTTCDSFHAYVSQRMRWTAGNLLSAHKFSLFLPYFNRSRITGVQRLHGLMQSVKTYAWIALTVPLLALPAGLLFTSYGEHRAGGLSNPDLVRVAYIIVWLTTKIWKRTVFVHVGTLNTFNLSNNRYWITPYIVYAFYQSFWVNLEDTEFEISGTFESPLDERSEKGRPALSTRMTDALVLMHTVYWLVASGVFLTRLWIVGHAIASGSSPHGSLLTGVMVRFFEIVLAASAPVRYMAFPPTKVDRRDRLARDDIGAKRAITKAWTKRSNNTIAWKEISELLLIIAYS